MDDEFLAVFTWHCCTFFFLLSQVVSESKSAGTTGNTRLLPVFFYSSQDEGRGGARMSFTKKNKNKSVG